MECILRGETKRKLAREQVLLRRGWKPIKQYNKAMGFVVVLGDSGYISTPYQSAVAIFDDEFRPNNPWVDHGGSALTDSGLVPEWFQQFE